MFAQPSMFTTKVHNQVRSATMKTVNRTILAAVATAGLALCASAPANAERVWDFGLFEDCMASMPDYVADDILKFMDWSAGCCAKSGGDWRTIDNPGRGECVSPPAEADNVPGSPPVTGQPRPPLAPNEGVSDDPVAGTPLPTPPPLRPGTSVG
jgi:hypothetical protein